MNQYPRFDGKWKLIDEITPSPMPDTHINYEKSISQPRLGKICPVCNGKGMVPAGFYDFHPSSECTIASTPEMCRACGGSGVI